MYIIMYVCIVGCNVKVMVDRLTTSPSLSGTGGLGNSVVIVVCVILVVMVKEGRDGDPQAELAMPTKTYGGDWRFVYGRPNLTAAICVLFSTV